MKRIGLTILILMTAIFLFGCNNTEEAKNYTYTQENGVYCVQEEGLVIEMDEQAFADQGERDRATSQLLQALEKAKTFLTGRQAAQTQVQCRLLSGDGVSQVRDGEVDIYYYNTIPQPYVNYMVQALLGTDVPDFLREGVAAYGAQQMGESLADSYAQALQPLWAQQEGEESSGSHVTLTDMAKALAADEKFASGSLAEAKELGDMLAGISEQADGEEAQNYHAAYCIYAGSFIEYWAEQQGIDTILDWYEEGADESAMEESLPLLMASWRQEGLNS